MRLVMRYHGEMFPFVTEFPKQRKFRITARIREGLIHIKGLHRSHILARTEALTAKSQHQEGSCSLCREPCAGFGKL